MSPIGFLLLIAAVDSSRIKKRVTRATPGRVSHVFSFGAPHPSNPKLTKKGGGCFSGYRITAFEDDWMIENEDIVPTLLVPSSYNHPHIQTLVLMKAKKSGVKTTWKCGDNPWRFTNPHVDLHYKSTYMSLMKKVTDDKYSRAKEAAFVGLDISYENEDKATDMVNKQGWDMLATAKTGEDVSHLVQDPKTKRCILTFEGSDSFDDFVADAKVKRVSFCGLGQKVHLGFRDELRKVVGSSSWQSKVRSQLGKCSSVDVVGHSLGGAVATLFAACIDDQNGSDDYKNMSWTQG